MTATEKQQDFQKRLIQLIQDFNKENEDLFVDDIELYKAEGSNLRRELLGVTVKILVQPR